MPHDTTRFRPLVIGAVAIALGVAPASATAQASPSDECPASTPTFRVGHRIEPLTVTGTLGEQRPLQVHVWYPARVQDDCGEAADFVQGPGGCRAPQAAYTSRLNGVPLLPPWSPLSWTIAAGNAFEGPRVAGGDERFPVIVFSHGNTDDAIDYAYTLETLASYGYVVAAPDHLDNTQDDVRIDVVNTTALKNGLIAPGQSVIACLDGLPPWAPSQQPGQPPVYQPCSHASIPDGMIDRYRDVEAVLDALPSWFGPRVDMERVGVMGHSRGTVTALSVAGGSSGVHEIPELPLLTPILSWGRQLGNAALELPADPRVKAVMGMAIGAPSVTFAANVEDVTVPVLLAAGTHDATSPLTVSALAWKLVAHRDPNADKKLATIQDAVHRHFDSALCSVMQSSAAIAEDSSQAVLDRETARQILQPPSLAHPGSGVAMDFCGFQSFLTPTDVRPFATAITGFTVIPFEGTPVIPAPPKMDWAVPTYGLTSDAVKDQVVALAATFFGRVLNRAGDDHRPFIDCLPEAFRNQLPVPQPTQRDLDDAEQHANDPD